VQLDKLSGSYNDNILTREVKTMSRVTDLFKKVFKVDTDIPSQVETAKLTEGNFKVVKPVNDRKVIETVLDDLRGRVVRLTFVGKSSFDYPVYRVESVVDGFLELRGLSGRFGKKAPGTYWQNLSTVDSITQLTGEDEDHALNG